MRAAGSNVSGLTLADAADCDQTAGPGLLDGFVLWTHHVVYILGSCLPPGLATETGVSLALDHWHLGHPGRDCHMVTMAVPYPPMADSRAL